MAPITVFVWVLACGCCAPMLGACGSSSKSSTTAGNPATGGTSTTGTAGTASGGSHQGAGGASSTADASTNVTGGTSGSFPFDPSEPIDPSVFDLFPPDDPPEPRTDGDRVEPGSRVACPEQEPDVEDACDDDGLTCTYGDTAVWACRQKYVCDSVWTRVGRDCPELPEGYCTDKPQPGTECTPQLGDFGAAAATCEFEELICYCPSCDRLQPCVPSDQPRWMCITPPVDLDCPLLPPNFGEGCAKQAQRCVYGNPCLENGVIVFCRNGAWEEEPAGCDESP